MCIHAKLKLDPTGEGIKEGGKKGKQELNHKVVHSCLRGEVAQG